MSSDARADLFGENRAGAAILAGFAKGTTREKALAWAEPFARTWEQLLDVAKRTGWCGERRIDAAWLARENAELEKLRGMILQLRAIPPERASVPAEPHP